MPPLFKFATTLIAFTLFPLTLFNLWAFIHFHVSSGFFPERERARNFTGFLIGLIGSWIVIAIDTFYKNSLPDPELRIQPALLRVGIYIAIGFVLGIVIDKLTGALDKRNLSAVSIAFFTVFVVLSIYNLVVLKEIRYVITFGILGWTGYLLYGEWSEKRNSDPPGSFLDHQPHDPDESEIETPDRDDDQDIDRSDPK